MVPVAFGPGASGKQTTLGYSDDGVQTDRREPVPNRGRGSAPPDADRRAIAGVSRRLHEASLRGKPADKCWTARAKALGNSMAVNCMEWIGEDCHGGGME